MVDSTACRRERECEFGRPGCEITPKFAAIDSRLSVTIEDKRV